MSIGLWLDNNLTDVERDRVIAAQEWWYSNADTPDATCLVGHVIAEPNPWEAWRVAKQRSPEWHAAATRYDALKKRFGLDLTVRLIKARAAKRNRIDLAVPAEAARVDA